MKNETTLQVGDGIVFADAMENLGVQQVKDERPTLAQLWGLKVFENTLVPKNEAWLMLGNKIIKKFKLN